MPASHGVCEGVGLAGGVEESGQGGPPAPAPSQPPPGSQSHRNQADLAWALQALGMAGGR